MLPTRAGDIHRAMDDLIRGLSESQGVYFGILFRAITSLRPHVIAVATPEPFLIATGIVCREDGDRRTAAPWARSTTLFGICGTIPVIHSPAHRELWGSFMSCSCRKSPIKFSL